MSTLMAIDLGGTNLRAAVVPAGVLGGDVPETVLRTAAPASLAEFRGAVAPVIEAKGVQRLGIGVPGLVAGTRCKWVPNLPWLDGVELSEVFPSVEVVCGNDVQVALLAEAARGAAADCEGAILLAIGTGIGSAVLAGGRILKGPGGAAASFGWACGDEEGSATDHSGWLEERASGRAFDRVAADLGMPDGSALLAAARHGDVRARSAFESAGRALGTTLAGAVALTGAQLIVISGAVAAALDLMAPAMRTRLDANLPPHLRGVDIRPGRFGGGAGLFGAALAAARHPLWETPT